MNTGILWFGTHSLTQMHTLRLTLRHSHIHASYSGTHHTCTLKRQIMQARWILYIWAHTFVYTLGCINCDMAHSLNANMVHRGLRYASPECDFLCCMCARKLRTSNKSSFLLQAAPWAQCQRWRPWKRILFRQGMWMQPSWSKGKKALSGPAVFSLQGNRWLSQVKSLGRMTSSPTHLCLGRVSPYFQQS